MTRISTAALAAALMLGAGATAATPAAAKKADAQKGQAGGGLVLSEAVRTPALAAQTAIQAKDYATAATAVGQVEVSAKTDDEKYIAAALRYALESGKLYDQQGQTNGVVNEGVLVAPLNALIASPKTPADKKGAYLFQRGAISFNTKQYAQASADFQQAKALGETNAQLPLLIVKSKVEAGDTAGGMAELEQLINAGGGKASEDLYRYALTKSYQSGNKDQTLKWAKAWVTAYPTAKNWHDVLALYGLSQKSLAKLTKQQAIDIFRLMRATKALADQVDFEQYGQYAIDIGLPDEAKAVIIEGRTSGKLPATGGGGQAVLNGASKAIASEGSFAALETRAKSAATGQLSAQTGDAYLGRGDYAKAIALYRQALQKGGVTADVVNLHLGIALALSGDKAGAKTTFATVTGAPGSEIAGLWTTWCDAPPIAS